MVVEQGWGWNRWNNGWGWGGWNRAGALAVFVSSFSPGWGSDPCWNGGWGVNNGIGGGFSRISGTADDAYAPAVTLNNAAARNPVAMAQPIDTSGPAGTFRYDGGPANPVPQPKPDAAQQVQPVPPPIGLPVSLKKETKPASPYTYKAYGEK